MRGGVYQAVWSPPHWEAKRRKRRQWRQKLDAGRHAREVVPRRLADLVGLIGGPLDVPRVRLVRVVEERHRLHQVGHPLLVALDDHLRLQPRRLVGAETDRTHAAHQRGTAAEAAAECDDDDGTKKIIRSNYHCYWFFR